MRWVGLISLLFSTPAFSQVADDWAFKPMSRPVVPEVKQRELVRNPIDAFVLHQLEAKGLSFNSTASKQTLIRRLSFDLVGLPPTPEEIREFVADQSTNAYEKVVERLLSSPRYGERSALFWLDLVRFAESDGFKADDKRPFAWRYRDYVIQSLNQDKSYARFLSEQLAGDELYPDDLQAFVATGFLRHYPDEYNAVNLEQRRQEILNDITDTVGHTFMGITLGCAKCHIHKFDPIEQTDYYRIQAFFAGWSPTEKPMLVGQALERYQRDLKAWQDRTAEVRKQLEQIEKPFREKFASKRRFRFPEEYSKLLDVPEAERTPMQKQIAAMVGKQVYIEDEKAMFAGMKPEEKTRWEALKQQLEALGPKPYQPAMAMGMSDVGRVVPETRNLKRGNWRNPAKDELPPGYISVIRDEEPEIPVPANGTTSGRRAVLAKWLTEPEHPLTSRVMVNRIWQQHFGVGIVATPADLGTQGARPTHPEMLDWLAREFIARGWSIKEMHRLIVTSQTYRQDSASNEIGLKIDPDNHLLWRMNRKRLDGEAIRDTILFASGNLNPKMGGVSIQPELPAEIKPSGWTVTASETERNRRSIYVYVKRNLRYPIFTAFDAPDRNETCSARFVTTTAPQALMLLNDQLILKQANLFASRVTKEAGNQPERVLERAFELSLGRQPVSEERVLLRNFLTTAGVDDFCHSLLNLNEFIYID